MAFHQFGRNKECSLELGEVRFALLFADTLLFRRFDCVGYSCCLDCCLFVVKQIVSVSRCGAVNSDITVNCGVELSELVELSGCIIGCGLKIDTLDLVASVNLVDLDASVDGAFVVFITCFV